MEKEGLLPEKGGVRDLPLGREYLADLGGQAWGVGAALAVERILVAL